METPLRRPPYQHGLRGTEPWQGMAHSFPTLPSVLHFPLFGFSQPWLSLKPPPGCGSSPYGHHCSFVYSASCEARSLQTLLFVYTQTRPPRSVCVLPSPGRAYTQTTSGLQITVSPQSLLVEGVLPQQTAPCGSPAAHR